jgi:hypothetical protein
MRYFSSKKKHKGARDETSLEEQRADQIDRFGSLVSGGSGEKFGLNEREKVPPGSEKVPLVALWTAACGLWA